MPIYKPSELMDFLQGLGVNPKKALSQNFLIDGNIIRKIVSKANVTEQDTVLEIGPGPGSLTEALLETGAHVIAVEKDKVLAEALERLKAPNRRLDVFCEDILEFAFEKYCADKKLKVIANLPYNITTPIIAKLIPRNDLFSSLTLMVQDEVARRFTAKPGTSEYSSFTVFLNFFSTPLYSFGVSKNCFYPIPRVESAIVKLELKEHAKVSSEDAFFKMTRTSFEHRRKMLRASLKELYTPEVITKSLTDLGLNPLARPEELSLEQFISLFEQLQHST
jgi:16S rRNA (adenine1518-N6/adenine1519-N6)-dimethyltransferase